MRRALVLTLALATATISKVAPAYDPLTHFDMSERAAQKSVLGQGSTLSDLGLTVIDDASQTFPSTPGDLGAKPPCRHGDPMTVLQLIACGSQFEDIPGTRSFNHFFDPAHNIPLTTFIGPAVIGQPGSLLGFPNLKSPDWAFQDSISVNVGSAQEFAYKNGRSYFLNALTSPLQADRSANWGKLFQTIGQVIHHPQDMAQPQHVRNDAHCDSILCVILDLATLGRLGIHNPSKFETYSVVNQNVVRALEDTADGNAVYPGPGNANVSVFDTPRKFFVGAGKGIAEYTNSNFVSAGTNFTFDNGTVRTNPFYTQPVPGQADPKPIAALFPPNGIPSSVQFGCRFDPGNCVMTFFSTSGTDPLTGAPFTNARASTLSIFDQDLEAQIQFSDPGTGQNYSTRKIFAMNRFNFDAARPPRLWYVSIRSRHSSSSNGTPRCVRTSAAWPSRSHTGPDTTNAFR